MKVPSVTRSAAVLAVVAFFAACDGADQRQVQERGPAEPAVSQPGAPSQQGATHDLFMMRLQTLCAQAFEGGLAEGTAPGDTAFQGQRMVMHVRECEPGEVRIPLHVGEDRSRTWIITRTEDGLRLKHDHRHEDGSEDEITQYGGDTRSAGTGWAQEFHADAFTAELVPEARTNIWRVEVEPGRSFAYSLRREGTDRRVRFEFDLSRQTEVPPAPWGH